MRALVTRPRENAGSIAKILAERDIEVLLEPLLDIRPTEHGPIDLDGIQAVLVTSPIGARTFAEATSARDVPVYAVGDATAEMLREAGFSKVESARGDGEALAALVMERLDPKKGPLLHASGRTVAGELNEQLTAGGFEVRRVELYAARPAAALSDETVSALREGSIDIALFFSPRTAQTFTRLIGEAGVSDSCAGIRAFCISPAVADAVKELKWADVLVAEKPDQQALLDRVDAHVAGRTDSPAGERAAAPPAEADATPPRTSPPERARSSAAPAFVAIALALAAIVAVVVLWRNQESLSARVDGPDEPTVQAVEELRTTVRDLTATVGDLETRLEQGGGAAADEIERRIAEVRDATGTRMEEIGDSLASAKARIEELAAESLRRSDLQELAAGVDEIAARLDREASEVRSRIDELRSAVERAQRAADEAAGKTTAAAMLALGQLEAALEAGRPFEEPLSRIRRLVDDMPEPVDALEGWGDRASTGIPTLAALDTRFRELVREAGREVEADAGPAWLNQAIERAASIVSVRRVGDDVEGDSRDAILARAEAAIGRDDLSGAVAEVDQLSGKAATLFADWLADARARLAATGGVDELEDLVIASAGGRGR